MMKRLLIALALSFPVSLAAGDDPEVLMKSRCVGEWEDDFRMQRYCVDKEIVSMTQVGEYIEKHGLHEKDSSDPRYRILSKCLSEWTDEHGPYWRMVHDCNRKQAEAWESMR